jgi:hypothetical protein
MINRMEPALVMMLVDRCRWYELALRRHGFTSEKLMERAELVAWEGVRRRGATLNEERMSDLIARLIRVGLEAVLRYDPEREHMSYGRNGGSPFSSYLSDIMDKRIDDHFRSRAEGFSDRRYENYGVVEPSDTIEQEHRADVEEAVERLDGIANIEWYKDAAAIEGLPLADWIVRGLNERASRNVTRPTPNRQRREVTAGPDHWPGSVEVA